MNAYSPDRLSLLKHLETDPKTGLSAARAEELLREKGPNKLREKKRKTAAQRFFAQFADVMILILIAAAAVSFFVAAMENDAKGFFEPALILLIVIVNAVLGVMQESKAEKALDALKSLSAPHARVTRDGAENLIEAALLVPGDIIHLEAGDFVPADARLLLSSNLKCEESALTGESVPSEKDAEAAVPDGAPLGDRANMVFSGCSVTYGTAEAVVAATGMDTEMGRIANLLNEEEDGQTPLQKKLQDLGKYLGIAALAACAVIFLIGILDGIPVLDIFMVAVSLAVSAIPEGLPAIITIVLSIGVTRMVKKNAIIRRLPAVETLGGASVICSDKTGTLTQNRMTLMKAYADGAEEPEDIGPGGSEALRDLLRLGSLCSNGQVVFEGETEKHLGDPTETAIVLAAHKSGMPRDLLMKAAPRLLELPFDSDRKRMSVVVQEAKGPLLIVKGAIDSIAPLCVKGNLERAKAEAEAMSERALRVLAIATRRLDRAPERPSIDEIEKDLEFRGLVGMIDPARPEAREAVRLCRRAGIKPVMITGDHVTTASAIARDLGILREGDLSISGSALKDMTDEELDGEVRKIAVYARVSPEDKIRIVKAWQRQGEVVSMTGDGVNDAPALKAADIGCAMGITGTDVAKGAADITLTDDNFATIVDAVREGRGIYENIKKVVGFLLGTNIGEILTVFFAMLIWRESPLISMQLLLINLVTDSFPAIALGQEPVEEGVMDRPPKPRDEGIFAHGLALRIGLQGLMFALLTLAAFYIGRTNTGLESGGQTMAFFVLSMSQVFQAFNMRSNRSLFAIGPFTNKKLNAAAALSAALVAVVLFTPVRVAFGLEPLSPALYLIALGLSLLPVALMELSKAIGLIKHTH